MQFIKFQPPVSIKTPPALLTKLKDLICEGHHTGSQSLNRWIKAHLEGSDLNITSTGSCTQALELSGFLMNLGSDDEIIVSSFTFPTSASVFAIRGAKIRFADINPDSLTMNVDSVARLITPKTKAIVFTHYLGGAKGLLEILDLAKKNNLFVIEDAACGLGAKVFHKHAGTLGDFAAFSFHRSKSYGFDHGGALISTLNPKNQEVLSWILNKGTNREAFLRAQAPQYEWMVPASYYGISEFSASMVICRLEDFNTNQAIRKRIWHKYQSRFAEFEKYNLLKRPYASTDLKPSYHGYYIRLGSAEERIKIQNYLSQNKIESVIHYQPLHKSPAGLALSSGFDCCPEAEAAANQLLRLPIYPEMETEQDFIISCIETYFHKSYLRAPKPCLTQ
jgi:dTDP-4-amino-4,6-dideoxygalactose transaminase